MSLLKFIPRFRHLDSELSGLHARESWSRARLDVFQLERLNQLWRSAIQHTAYYRDLTQRLYLPREFVSLAEFSELVPRLTKHHVRSERLRLLSDVRRPGKWKMTGGSTGDPTRVYWGGESHRESLRGKYRFLQSHGIEPLDPMVFLWGHAASFEPGLRGACDRAKQWLADRLRKRLRLSAYRTDASELRAYVRRMQRFGATSLYGYSSAVHLLAREALALDADFPGLRAVIMTAEPVLPLHKRQVAAAFHVPAVEEYGSVECGFLAGQAPDGTLRVREDQVLLETEPDGRGGYDILVTTLGNASFPLIRYAIGDATDAPLIRHKTGFAQLERVLGRANDFILTPQGKLLHPIAFMDCLEILTPHLGRFHLHQGADFGLTLEVEAAVQVRDPRWKDIVQRRLTEFTAGLPVRIETVLCVSRTAAGKRRFITSALAPRDLPRGRDDRFLESLPPAVTTDNRELV